MVDASGGIVDKKEYLNEQCQMLILFIHLTAVLHRTVEYFMKAVNVMPGGYSAVHGGNPRPTVLVNPPTDDQGGHLFSNR